MPKFNADTAASLCEPVVFTLGGREFTVIDPDDAAYDAMEAIGKEVEAGTLSLGAALNRKLSLLTGEPEETFAGFSLRRKGAVCRWATTQLLDPLGEKGAPN
jgi:hypothetical protein